MLTGKILASGVLLMLFSALVWGQGATGTISGSVTDPNGAVVSGAGVKVTSVATNFTRETTSNGDGSFTVGLLAVGNYRVEITMSGFAKYSALAEVNIAQVTSVDGKLSLSGVSGVQVDVGAPTIQVETSQNGRTITGDTLRQLPLPSRNFQQLLA